MAAVSCNACMAMESRGRPACNNANDWKLIAACLTIHLNGGPFLAMGDHFSAKIGPPGQILAAKFGPRGSVLAKFLPKSVQGDHFGGILILV